MNETEEKMLEIARAVGLDHLQLHGDEPPALVLRLERILPVIKAVRGGKSFRAGATLAIQACQRDLT